MNNLTYKALIVSLLSFLLFQLPVQSQNGCVTNGIEVTIKPSAPLQFQFFPMSLLGIGSGGASGSLTGFQQFGVEFMLPSTSPAPQEINIRIKLYVGSRSIFHRPMEVSLTIPNNNTPYFVSVPQFINGNLPPALYPTAPRTPKIDESYANELAGGMPSGNFRFEILTAPGGSGNYQLCGVINCEVATGATVDLILPANNAETSNLPFFQWAAVGGDKFLLSIAKVKPNQSYINALGTSSQRAIIELNNTRSYQSTAGGPVGARENNLNWNPGLVPGQYCYQITMIQSDPITGSQNLVPSPIYAFVVPPPGRANMSGLNTQEIINILSSKLNGYDLENVFNGFDATTLEINGTAATVEDLRAKVSNLPKAFKVEIKP